MWKPFLLFCLALGACSPYQPTSEYPPTPSRWQAHFACDHEANQAAGPERRMFGAIGAIATSSTYGPVYEDCMTRHGWARS